jgi:molybdopterin-guanine dinucleotide biosynthesis protein A
MHLHTSLKGLVLCGGYSTRMQQDKSNISYHGMPQWQYLYTLLSAVVPEVYISCRPDQQEIFAGTAPLIPDTVTDGGPAAGLLSAYTAFPDTAWLVLACDLPLISHQSLHYLAAFRDPQKAATAFISPVNHLPEPLIAIWEPRGLEVLRQSVASGKQCPRKALLQTDIQVLENPYAVEQFNANTPEEMQEALKKIN